MLFSTLHTAPWKTPVELWRLPHSHSQRRRRGIGERNKSNSKNSQNRATPQDRFAPLKREAHGYRPRLDRWLSRLWQKLKHQFFKEKHGFPNKEDQAQHLSIYPLVLFMVIRLYVYNVILISMGGIRDPFLTRGDQTK